MGGDTICGVEESSSSTQSVTSIPEAVDQTAEVPTVRPAVTQPKHQTVLSWSPSQSTSSPDARAASGDELGANSAESVISDATVSTRPGASKLPIAHQPFLPPDLKASVADPMFVVDQALAARAEAGQTNWKWWAAGMIFVVAMMVVSYVAGWQEGKSGKTLVPARAVTTTISTPTPNQSNPASVTDGDRQDEVKAVAAALASCYGASDNSYMLGRCDSIDNLSKTGYLKTPAPDVRVAVTNNDTWAVAYAALNGTDVKCDIGLGAQHYYVYHASADQYRTECLDGLPKGP